MVEWFLYIPQSRLTDHFGTLESQGAQRIYVWFVDFAPPETITEFGETAINA